MIEVLNSTTILVTELAKLFRNNNKNEFALKYVQIFIHPEPI
jgi:hypothetical protein